MDKMVICSDKRTCLLAENVEHLVFSSRPY